MKQWNELSMKEKHDIIRESVSKGIHSLDDIKAYYDNYYKDDIHQLQEGGERNYQTWKSLIAKYKGLDIDNDNTYDYEGYYNAYPNEAWDMLNDNPEAHFTDEFKTVYHPTFSNESSYSGKVNMQFNPYGKLGGTWTAGDVFIPAYNQPWPNRYKEGGDENNPKPVTTGGAGYVPNTNYSELFTKLSNLYNYAKRYVSGKINGTGDGTVINLSDKNVARIKSDTDNVSTILANEFVENNSNTVRRKKDFVNTTDTLLGDRKIPLSKISTFYGIENGKLKAGPLEIFNDTTTVVPNRAKNVGKIKEYHAAPPLDRSLMIELKNKVNEEVDKYNKKHGFKNKWYQFKNYPFRTLINNVGRDKAYLITDSISVANKDILKDYTGAYIVTENNDTIKGLNFNDAPKILFADENGNAVFAANTYNNTEELNKYLQENSMYPIMVDNGRYQSYMTTSPNVGIYSGIRNPDNMFIIGTKKSQGGPLIHVTNKYEEGGPVIEGGELPEVTVIPNNIYLHTYRPLIDSDYKKTGHSALISQPLWKGGRNGEYLGPGISISNDGHNPNYNLLLNNCSDATRRALEAISGESINPVLFTTPGDVKDFAENQMGGVTHYQNGHYVTTIPISLKEREFLSSFKGNDPTNEGIIMKSKGGVLNKFVEGGPKGKRFVDVLGNVVSAFGITPKYPDTMPTQWSEVLPEESYTELPTMTANQIEGKVAPLPNNNEDFIPDFTNIKTKDNFGYNIDNLTTAYHYFKDNMKLNDYQIASLLANGIAESGFDPKAHNPKTSAKGLYQWLDGRYKYSSDKMSNTELLNEQLQYINDTLNNTEDQMSWHHGGDGSGYNKAIEAHDRFYNAKNLYDAVHSFTYGYNRPDSVALRVKQRYDLAQKILERLQAKQHKDGGKIYIKPENRGKFTALKKRTGHSASWFKAHGTPAQKKMATFALNAKKWKHDDGGYTNIPNLLLPPTKENLIYSGHKSWYNK